MLMTIEINKFIKLKLESQFCNEPLREYRRAGEFQHENNAFY